MPLAILWGVLFSLLTLIYVWVLSPLLRVLEVVFAIFRRVSPYFKDFRGKILLFQDVDWLEEKNPRNYYVGGGGGGVRKTNSVGKKSP